MDPEPLAREILILQNNNSAKLKSCKIKIL